MYNSVIRELNGRILGKIGNDFFEHYDENESWHDIKIAPEDIIFPKHNNTKPGPVKVYHISEVNYPPLKA